MFSFWLCAGGHCFKSEGRRYDIPDCCPVCHGKRLRRTERDVYEAFDDNHLPWVEYQMNGGVMNYGEWMWKHVLEQEAMIRRLF